MDFDIPQILKGFGLSEESVERVRLSRGVVGRTTYVVAILLVLLAIIAARISVDSLLWIAVLGVVAFLIYFVGVLRFAHKNPGAALLEGADLLRWQTTELAAKGTGPITIEHQLPTAPASALPPSGSDR